MFISQALLENCNLMKKLSANIPTAALQMYKHPKQAHRLSSYFASG